MVGKKKPVQQKPRYSSGSTSSNTTRVGGYAFDNTIDIINTMAAVVDNSNDYSDNSSSSDSSSDSSYD